MTRAGKILILGAVIGAGWWFYRQKSVSTESYIVDITDTLTGSINDFAGATVGYIDGALRGALVRVSNAKTVTADMLQNKNVQAFLQVIRKGEGTLGDVGYRTIFGGQTFTSFADHPRLLVKKSGYKSTAAGAYQFKIDSWDEVAGVMGLTDFSPKNQDLGAVGRIAMRGALADVMAGRFESAVKKCALEWASLPYSPYGQPKQTITQARSFYTLNGGIETA